MAARNIHNETQQIAGNWSFVYFTSTILHVKYTKLQNDTANNCVKPQLVLRSVRYGIRHNVGER